MTDRELEGLDEADCLLDGTSHGEVVDSDLPQDALRVDDEETAQSDTLVFDKHAVVPGYGHAAVGNQRKLEVGAEATFLACLGRPREMGKLGVG